MEFNPEEKQNCTYILRCCDGSYYTGWTNDLVHRLHMHRSGKGGKYTRAHLPVQLVYAEFFEDEHDARSREPKIKRLSRAEKEKLVDAMNEEVLIAVLEAVEETYPD